MSEPVIVLDRLSKFYGPVHAVEDLSFSIDSGEIFGFLGANGAGKTTTMRMLCGLTHPTRGTAKIDRADAWKQRHLVRRKFGYVAQRFSLYTDLTVQENMRFFGGACRVPHNELEVFPAECASSSRSAARLCIIRLFFFSTNRHQDWTPCIASKCGTCSTI